VARKKKGPNRATEATATPTANEQSRLSPVTKFPGSARASFFPAVIPSACSPADDASCVPGGVFLVPGRRGQGEEQICRVLLLLLLRASLPPLLFVAALAARPRDALRGATGGLRAYRKGLFAPFDLRWAHTTRTRGTRPAWAGCGAARQAAQSVEKTRNRETSLACTRPRGDSDTSAAF